MVSLPVVLLILITSNYPQEKLINEELLDHTTAAPEKGFAESGKSPPKVTHVQVNDLTAGDFKFPDEHSKAKVGINKMIREKTVPDEKGEKDKIPVPLYSLVKNDCGDGYALDENGVCQKTITARSGKKLDSDRRRKRHVLDHEWMTQRKKEISQNGVEEDRQKIPVECSKLYPGMVSDGKGGCKKSIRILEQPLDKTLPP